MTKDEIVKYTSILRDLFFDKINAEWSKKWQKKHGDVFDYKNIKNKNVFLDELLEDIRATIGTNPNQKELDAQIISIDNLRRLIIQEKPGEWQHKTRNNISKYVGFESWENFIEKNLKKVEKKTEVSNNSNQKLIPLILPILVLLAIVGYFVFRKSESDIKFEIVNSNIQSEYPALIKLKVAVPENKKENYSVKIESENFNYSNQPIKLKEGNQILPLNFFTPGIKKIALYEHSTKIKELTAIVTSGKGWYACTRIQSADIPQVFQSNQDGRWYGNEITTGNKASNYLTPPAIWKNYLISKNLEGSSLHFPSEYINQRPNFFSRVAFEKCQKFGVNINNTRLSFSAKRESLDEEDCLSFMMQLFDNEYNRFEFYSAVNCEIDDNISLSSKPDFSNSNVQKNEAFNTPNLNEILEDSNWHDIVFEFRDQVLTIKVDNVIKFSKNFKYKFKELTEIIFVFQGNGYLKNIKIEDSKTNKLISNEYI